MAMKNWKKILGERKEGEIACQPEIWPFLIWELCLLTSNEIYIT